MTFQPPDGQEIFGKWRPLTPAPAQFILFALLNRLEIALVETAAHLAHVLGLLLILPRLQDNNHRETNRSKGVRLKKKLAAGAIVPLRPALPLPDDLPETVQTLLNTAAISL